MGHCNLPKLKKDGVLDLSYKGQGKISQHVDKYLRSLLILYALFQRVNK